MSLGIACLFMALGVLIKYFKCYWLIAGYNTASPEQKKNVDIEGLGRFIGNSLFVMSAILAISYILLYMGCDTIGIWVKRLMYIIIPYIVIKAQRYKINSKDKSQKTEGVKPNIIIIVLLLIFMGGLTIYTIIPHRVDVNSEQIKISSIFGTEIKMSVVTNVVLKDEIPKIIVRTSGVGLGNIRKGLFRLQDIGMGKLYIYTDKPPYLYIFTEKDYTIINYKDSKETEELYHTIKSCLGKE